MSHNIGQNGILVKVVNILDGLWDRMLALGQFLMDLLYAVLLNSHSKPPRGSFTQPYDINLQPYISKLILSNLAARRI
ncbi:hypothetical protein L1887_29143 [Cichorium endivia]|nr:hypothetical protein L1887_29143 [Cichorium endivia]